MKTLCLMLALLTLLISSASAETASCEFFTMDTYIYITCTGEKAQEAAEESKEALTRLNDLLSVGVSSSEIAVINRCGYSSVSRDTADIITAALDICQSTGGAFDITVFPLMELWGFTTGSFRVPSESEISDALGVVGSTMVQYDAENACVTLTGAQGIDLGGIAKGFASDRIMQIFESYGIASGYVSLGGNVQVYGTKTDGSLWKIGIQDPYDNSSVLGVVKARNCALITSGAYQRNFTDEETGKVYHHIIDPTTGRPSESGLVSVTVVSEKGMLADALSTACFIMGKDGAVEYWRQYGDDFELVLMTDDTTVYATEGLENCLSCRYPVTIVRRQPAD